MAGEGRPSATSFSYRRSVTGARRREPCRGPGSPRRAASRNDGARRSTSLRLDLSRAGNLLIHGLRREQQERIANYGPVGLASAHRHDPSEPTPNDRRNCRRLLSRRADERLPHATVGGSPSTSLVRPPIAAMIMSRAGRAPPEARPMPRLVSARPSVSFGVKSVLFPGLSDLRKALRSPLKALRSGGSSKTLSSLPCVK